jgi:endoplasmic reticulum-Golgi intermediate compartment protein 3
MNITLPRCPCHILSLDIVDVTGVHIVDVHGRLSKFRLDENGNRIGGKDLVSLISNLQSHYS